MVRDKVFLLISWLMGIGYFMTVALGVGAVATLFNPSVNAYSVMGVSLMACGVIGILDAIRKLFMKPPVKPA
jgi:hypothetical protein